ncbi:MAG: TIGR02206 family membrane protein [Candidatus Omnitrophica bacterium]|nr:TIGR02206 family membrane protein [Candidatus Omnitrophota bacterium]MBI3021250.1 TIGR02206 family membrane protein [Candidatus Omnitrophota bacterium]MBI3082853.1 TIGR02206 family membrane protein [Candidatus Omnitrophota bacterium]
MPHAGGFTLWGPDHLTVLGLTAGGIAGLVMTRRRLRGRSDQRLRHVVAAALVANELSAWAVSAVHGVVRVPLQLCDLALGLAVWALLTTRPAVSEVAYFWGLAGSLQAILTPDLRLGFPDYWWIKFFLTHCGVVLSVVYLAVTARVAPTGGSVWRVWALANVYAAIAGLINWGFGTNYGYLAHKPSQPSLLDYFGPWPWYIVGLEAAALCSFSLYYAPFALAQRFRSGGR